MYPEYNNGNVIAHCPDCGGLATFENMRNGGNIIRKDIPGFHIEGPRFVYYALLKCAACSRGGLAVVRSASEYKDGILSVFYPVTFQKKQLPQEVPDDIAAEFREAELCIGFGALRAASALFRSALEKALQKNGYLSGTLYDRIDEAAEDGVITEARRLQAHDNVRVLGNDVLHDAWRVVEISEAEDSHHYVQRILEDLYDSREVVQMLLKQKGRANTEE